MSIEQYLVPIDHSYAHRDRGANICFDCDRACGGCSWSEVDLETKRTRFEPVPGWTAKKVLLHGDQTYHITACPLFKPDPLGRTEQQDGTDRECNELRTFYK